MCLSALKRTPLWMTWRRSQPAAAAAAAAAAAVSAWSRPEAGPLLLALRPALRRAAGELWRAGPSGECAHLLAAAAPDVEGRLEADRVPALRERLALHLRKEKSAEGG